MDQRCCRRCGCGAWSRSRGCGGIRRPSAQRCKGCCDKCTARLAKVFLIVPNFVCLLLGGALLTFGLWIHANSQYTSVAYHNLLRIVPTGPLMIHERLSTIFILLGGSVAILSFLGCCGACAESPCFLCLYTFLIVCALVTEVTTGVLLTAMQRQAFSRLKQSMHRQLLFAYNSSAIFANDTSAITYHVTEAWDSMQNTRGCCGVNGPEDYQLSLWLNRTSELDRTVVVPSSCCIGFGQAVVSGQSVSDERRLDMTSRHLVSSDLLHIRCQRDALLYVNARRFTASAVKTQGCYESMMIWLRANLTIIFTSVGGIITLQMLDLVSSCVLLRWMRRKELYYSYYDDCDYD